MCNGEGRRGREVRRGSGECEVFWEQFYTSTSISTIHPDSLATQGGRGGYCHEGDQQGLPANSSVPCALAFPAENRSREEVDGPVFEMGDN